MNSGRHDEDHELWLASLLAGEVTGDDARAGLAACATCARRHAELSEVTAALHGTAAERERDLASARKLAPTVGETELARRLEELATELPPRPRRSALWLAAAAVLLATGTLWWQAQRAPDEPTPTPVELGPASDSITLLAPLGTQEPHEFHWRDSEPASAGYVLYVFDAALPDDAPFVLRQLCQGTSWTPDEERLALLPRRFRWYVVPRDVDGLELAPSSSAEVELP